MIGTFQCTQMDFYKQGKEYNVDIYVITALFTYMYLLVYKYGILDAQIGLFFTF